MRTLATLRAFVSIAFVTAATAAFGQEAGTATVVVHGDQPAGAINREIYGQFAEHLGRCVYEGIWVGEDSPIPNVRGIRKDVVAALKEIQVPTVRWPGGCFADEYHWRDGIGPRDERPKRINSHWGGVVETNQFGTHEFLDFCEQIGCQPYISANVGSGTPQELMEWVEYMTSDADTTLVAERKKNGRDKPWRVPFIGVGNESWGCGGNMNPDEYAALYRRYNTFVKNFSGNRITRIACGSNGMDYHWTDVVMNSAAKQMNGISLHWYSLPTGNWNAKGSATDFGEDQWASLMGNAWRMEELVTKHSAIMDKYDPMKRVGLVVDEWGAWYDVEPGTNPGFLYQQNTMRDAVLAGITLNIFHQHSDRVKMAAIAQMVNVLQSMILTDKEKMVLTPTYWVFDLYKVHQGATLLPTDVTAEAYKNGKVEVPGLSVSASRDATGKTHVSLVNINPSKPLQVTLKADGVTGKMTAQTLAGKSMNARNTFDHPDEVKPAALAMTDARIMLPPASVTVVEYAGR
jgi:alpha-N-arabinofuranosidase